MIEYFLSTGGKGPKPGEFYRKSPELALDYIEAMPEYKTEDYLVFAPLSDIDTESGETIDGVIQRPFGTCTW